MNTLFVTAGKNLYSLVTEANGFRHPFDLPKAEVILSTEGIVNTNDIYISPNPVSSDRIIITAKSVDLNKVQVNFSDLSGKHIEGWAYSSKGHTGEIRFPRNLPAATYLLKIKNRKQQFVLRVIVE